MKIVYNHSVPMESRAFFTRILLPYPVTYHAIVSYNKHNEYPWSVALQRGELFYFLEIRELNEEDLRRELDRAMNLISSELENPHTSIKRRENDPEVSYEDFQKMIIKDREIEGKRRSEIEKLMEKIGV